jgi:hypothetical protein
VTEGTYTCRCGHKSVGHAAAAKHIQESHPEEATGNVMYLGFREVPESEQVWEIHLRPPLSTDAEEVD